MLPNSLLQVLRSWVRPVRPAARWDCILVIADNAGDIEQEQVALSDVVDLLLVVAVVIVNIVIINVVVAQDDVDWVQELSEEVVSVYTQLRNMDKLIRYSSENIARFHLCTGFQCFTCISHSRQNERREEM